MDQVIAVDPEEARDLALFNRLRALIPHGLTQFEAFRMGLHQRRADASSDVSEGERA